MDFSFSLQSLHHLLSLLLMMYYCVMTNMTNVDLKLIVLFKFLTKGLNREKFTEVD